MARDFVHLHVHSEYSLLDGMSKISGLIKKTKENGMKAIAITDHGAMYGEIDFYKKAIKEEIKPILGCEIYMSAEDHREKKRADAFHLTVLAQDLEGYRNLMKLVTISQTEGFYYKPRVSFELLEKYNKGLIALSGCPAGLVYRTLTKESYEAGKEITKQLGQIFEDRFYLEVQRHPWLKFAANKEVPERVRAELKEFAEEQKKAEEMYLKMSKELGLPIVATNDVHYVEEEDCVAQDAIVCIQTGKLISEVDRMRYVDTPDYYLKTREEMEQVFIDLPEALDNTVKLAEKVDIQITLGQYFFPKFDLDSGKTPGEALREMADEGAVRLFGEITEEIKKRLDFEMEVIDGKGYSAYFLIYADMTKFSRENDIYINTRGSAAGSLVSYCCGITTVDPLRYHLPFERFLNPMRPSAPDIDLDISDDRREDMIAYLKRRYGEDKVAQICTFGTMQARAAVRDIGRVLGMPYSGPDRISKMIPMGSQGFPMSIKRAFVDNPDLKKVYDAESESRKLLDLAQKVEGNVRHISVHAAGIVVSPTELTDFTPLQKEPGGGDKIITQYEMHACEDVGLVKMDILGIRNLSIMANAIGIIAKTRGEKIDIYKIPIDDAKTFEMLSRGDTFGVFQMGSPGMTRYLMELEPTRVDDLMIMVALYRPGPMANITEFIARKKGLKPVTYYHPKMENFLAPSFGVLVYQDDLLYTALELAGYNWESVDKFRKAVGKKIPEEMARQHVIFVDGCIEHSGMTRDEAEGLWKLFEPFQGYGFNKCVVGETRVYGESGEPVTVEELYQKNIDEVKTVWGLGPNHRLMKQKIKLVAKNGVKVVYEMKLRSGRSLTLTGNHPILRFDGWKEAGKINKGDRVAVARCLPEGKGVNLTNGEMALLGYLIAEGNLCHPHGIYFYSANEAEIDDFMMLVDNLGLPTKIDRSKSTMSVYVGGGKNNHLREMCRKLGLSGKGAFEKEIPASLFNASIDQTSRLLAKMWQGDGCVDLRSLLTYYATSSEKLAQGVQSLLLKLGVISTVYKKNFKYRGGMRVGFTVNISHQRDLETFFEQITPHMVGEKRGQISKLLSHPQIKHKNQKSKLRVSTLDTIPAEVLGLVREEMNKAGLTVVAMSKASRLAERSFYQDQRKRGYTREVLRIINETLVSERLAEIIDADIYWDEVVEVKGVGKKMTYDLTLEGEHNFLANDIVVHNSHAASYGMVSYWTGYLKANYPVEYMAALLTAEASNTDKLTEAISECEKMAIKILPPDVNESLRGFTIVPFEDRQAIRFGLSAIKNVGEAAINAILEARKTKDFAGLSDFCRRVDQQKANKKVIESLVKAGAMDRFGHRAAVIAALEVVRSKASSFQKEKASGQQGLFGGGEAPEVVEVEKLPEVPEWDQRERLKYEKELLGFYLSGNPLRNILRGVESKITHKIAQLDANYHIGQTVTVAGVIARSRQVMTKKNNSAMAFGTLEDDTGSIESVVFPKTYEECKDVWVVDKPVIVEGKIDFREEALNLVVDTVEPIDESMADSAPAREIELEIPRGTDKEILMKVNQMLKENPGEDVVIVTIPNGGAPKRIRLGYGVDYTLALDKEIKKLLE